MILKNFPSGFRAAVWGASGGLGAAFVERLAQEPHIGEVIALSRAPLQAAPKVRTIRYTSADPDALAEAAKEAAEGGPLHLVLSAIGTLHGQDFAPEKALRQLDPGAFLEVMRINTLLPALIAKSSVGHLDPSRSVFGALSARVGSLSDNRLGGWHSYRASKAALNMMLKNIAIEVARKNKNAVILGLHPGTVDTALSEPFQANVPEGKLFTPQHSVERLLSVIDQAAPDQSGRCLDYAGDIVPF
ncbi:MAG: SDR family NAD(P)-dependent oxidoreductase [Pseudomonadota bacterium]